MNAPAIVEKLSLDLLVKGKIDRKALSPLLQKLRDCSLDETAVRQSLLSVVALAMVNCG